MAAGFGFKLKRGRIIKRDRNRIKKPIGESAV